MTDEQMTEQLYPFCQRYLKTEWFDLLSDTPYSEPLSDKAKRIIVERCNTWLKDHTQQWRVMTVEAIGISDNDFIDSTYRWTLRIFDDSVTYLPGARDAETYTCPDGLTRTR